MASAVKFFLKIDGIQGDSTDKTHQGEIPLLSFSWGATHAVVAVPGADGKVSVGELSFTASSGQASPELFQGITTGKVFPTATLTGGVQAEKGLVTLLELALKKVLIGSYRISDAAGAEHPVDEVTLSFAQIEFTYRPQKSDGTAGTPVAAGWDLERNQPA
jgi:type VI secretion system secreted protein Hcp